MSSAGVAWRVPGFYLYMDEFGVRVCDAQQARDARVAGRIEEGDVEVQRVRGLARGELVHIREAPGRGGAPYLERVASHEVVDGGDHLGVLEVGRGLGAFGLDADGAAAGRYREERDCTMSAHEPTVRGDTRAPLSMRIQACRARSACGLAVRPRIPIPNSLPAIETTDLVRQRLPVRRPSRGTPIVDLLLLLAKAGVVASKTAGRFGKVQRPVEVSRTPVRRFGGDGKGVRVRARGAVRALCPDGRGAFSSNTERAVRSDLGIYAAWCAECEQRTLPASRGPLPPSSMPWPSCARRRGCAATCRAPIFGGAHDGVLWKWVPLGGCGRRAPGKALLPLARNSLDRFGVSLRMANSSV